MKFSCQKPYPGTSLVVQWLRLCTSTKGGESSIPGWGTNIPHALWHSQNVINFKKEERKKPYPEIISLGPKPTATTVLLSGVWDLTRLCQIQENTPSWFVVFCFYLISLSYFYLLRYISLSMILQQRSNLRHWPPCMTFTVGFFHLKMVFSQDVCALRWTYNKVIKPDQGNTFSLWPSPCQQIPFSAHFRAPWKNHYQSLSQ